ncbi:MAG: pectin esterase [Bacteroidales bacterium]|nr:pectin esterase [Bacteroidales bacterium]
MRTFKIIIFFTFLITQFTISSIFAEDIYRVTVAKDGSCDYTTIQEAVNSIRDYGFERGYIYVKNGVYKEKVVVPTWKTRISLIGESVDSTIITWDDYSGKMLNEVKISTFTSYTVLVMGDGFYAENITFENTAGEVGQAVALHVEGDRCIFRNCKFLGNQDTMFAAGEGSRQYYKDCYIEGTTDFIFGAATALFEKCTIRSKRDSYITAASTPEYAMFGYVFIECKLIADTTIHQVYLGRPWRPYAKTVFINCELGVHMRPEGWHNWRSPEREKTAYYAEYKSTGPGADISGRVPWSHQLTPEEAKIYTIENIFSGQKEATDEITNWYTRDLEFINK